MDDIVVALDGRVQVEQQSPALRIDRQPVQVTGRYRGLVRFLAPEGDGSYALPAASLVVAAR